MKISKLIPIHAYRMDMICEVVYPENTNDFERQLLETITSNTSSQIKKALDGDNSEYKKSVEESMLNAWMLILGSNYRDYSNHVELSKYGYLKTIYKAEFISKFIYD